MSLSNELISQFVKITNDEKKPQTESTVYGTVKYDGKYYVQLDGSDLLTPVETTTDVKDGERVTVSIKDHTATITGNLTNPSASSTDVKENAKHISEFEIVMAYKVTTKQFEAVNAAIERLTAVLAEIGHLDAASAEIDELKAKLIIGESLTVNDINAIKATIESIEAKFGTFTDVSTENLEAMNAEITNLKGYTASFTYVLAEVLEATKASINDLYVKKLSADSANLKYANIDFANITEAAVDRLFGENGFIKDLTVEDQTLTGTLYGVEINADMIKTGTLATDRLLVKGENGLYYRLNLDCFDENGVPTVNATVEELQNGLHGQNIIAESVTADKIKVSDLHAFGATIGGFEIDEDSIHTTTKEFPDSSNRGIYLGDDGQFSIGDGDNYVKYIKDENNIFKLLIAAGSIADQINEATESLAKTEENIKKHFSFSDQGITISNGDNTLSLRLDAGLIYFEKNGTPFGRWDGIDFHTGNIKIEVTERAQFGNFGFVPRSDGSLSFLKLEHRTGFYVVLNGTLMTIFVAHPILEGTTMNTNDIPCEVSDTTLIMNGG